MKQFMAGGGIALIGVLLIPQLTSLFPAGGGAAAGGGEPAAVLSMISTLIQ
jgi:hypothetical protein